MFNFHRVKTTYTITMCFIFLVALLTIRECQCTQLYLMQGQEAHMTFSYPCDSTEVTLRDGNSAPFYRLTDGLSQSLTQYDINRFKVEKRNNGNCSLELTIGNLMRSDAGTYFSSIYKDGKLIDDLTTRVGLQIDYPPGKATCVKEEDKGGDWETIECTADVGSISGKIECYQDGEKMPSLNGPVETSITLTEIILIRKSKPAFCCSSTFDEYKSQCECNDTVLNLPYEGSKDPCPTTSLITKMSPVYNVTDSTEHYSTMISYTSMKIKEDNCKSVIIHSTIVPIEVTLLLLSLFVHYKTKTKNRTNHKDNDPPKSKEFLLNTSKPEQKNGSVERNGIVLSFHRVHDNS